MLLRLSLILTTAFGAGAMGSSSPGSTPSDSSGAGVANTSATNYHVANNEAAAPPPPPPPQWCPQLHPIHGNDPSGPMLVDGMWHVFVTCDDQPGNWGHYQSTDLVHWQQQPATDFDAATGSVVPLPSATGSFVAYWPNTSIPFPCCDIDSATTTNSSLPTTAWRHTGRAIARPADLSLHQGFRDPHRPLKLKGKWRMGVGSGSGADNTMPLAGRIRWFTATDDTLSKWSDSGIFFEVNSTVAGYVDADEGIVWNATRRRTLDQIECPDVRSARPSVPRASCPSCLSLMTAAADHRCLSLTVTSSYSAAFSTMARGRVPPRPGGSASPMTPAHDSSLRQARSACAITARTMRRGTAKV